MSRRVKSVYWYDGNHRAHPHPPFKFDTREQLEAHYRCQPMGKLRPVKRTVYIKDSVERSLLVELLGASARLVEAVRIQHGECRVAGAINNITSLAAKAAGHGIRA